MYQRLCPPLRVLLLDPQPIVLHGLAGLFASEPDIEVVGMATSLEELMPLARATRPDVLIAEIRHTDGDLFDRLSHLLALSRETKVIVFTFDADRVSVQRAMRFKISGYILKRSEPEAILDAVRAARRGGVFIDPALLGRNHAEIRPEGEDLATEERLSEREEVTLRLTAYGYSIKEIARELGVSPKSIETYKARASAKLGLASRSSIVRYALVSGWLTGERSQVSSAA
jgi:DNA-binding NarL/FixJ family response regulator